MDNTQRGKHAPSHYAAQTITAEDLLREQTVGLVQLDDFRKRRAEVLEQKERESREGSRTPRGDVDGVGPSQQPPARKKRKPMKRGKLSFGVDEDEDGEDSPATVSKFATPRSNTPSGGAGDDVADGGDVGADGAFAPVARRLGPNTSIANTPKVMTKSALLKEAQTREQLRKEFLAMQTVVKATDIAIPFVFYDGTDIPGGVCRVKKGEHVWLFLDKARKVGAESGVGGVDRSRREWARVGVDDLMLVRGEIIVPHHYEFYYFVANKTLGFHGPIFDYSARPVRSTASTTSADVTTSLEYDPLARPTKRKEDTIAIETDLEGARDDPGLTKVVDRRWYEKNKHIYPASVWEEFDPTKDYSTGIRKDTQGNAFFFS